MRLQPTTFDKKTYLTYLKGYMKKVKAHLAEKEPDRVEAFEKAAQGYAKKIVANFKDWEFYTGDGMDPDAMVVLLNYREDGTTPYLVFFKDGLKIEKVVCFLQRVIMLMDSKRCLSDVFLFLFVMEVVMYLFNIIILSARQWLRYH
jgi:hypothetical protein